MGPWGLARLCPAPVRFQACGSSGAYAGNCVIWGGALKSPGFLCCHAATCRIGSGVPRRELQLFKAGLRAPARSCSAPGPKGASEPPRLLGTLRGHGPVRARQTNYCQAAAHSPTCPAPACPP
ncbi:hypothetical protein NDU88_002032 [Pleurodeles waltl]|uniref:Uncharacterized protein n=1 Tax=Pleurodeles waltl TaxID=8319 RepID=A0AAV7WK38_PLEWA|nr:hypothetical protein NDU88_002032 [Pleurodeles waltl]